MSAWAPPATSREAAEVLARVAASGGPALARRLAAMALPPPAARRPGLAPPAAGEAADVDVLVLGGGLCLLVAQALAARGLGVWVVERQPELAAHRAWNASWPELERLVALELVSAAELAALVVARYRRGTCHWHGAEPTEVTGVLDCAVDAQRLIAGAGRRLQATGARLWLGWEATATAAGAHGVRVALAPADGGPGRTVVARAVVDARGFQSPDAQHDLICPTVGGVLEGLEEGPGAQQIDPTRGEILATTEDVEDGRQHIWEAFPAAPGQAAVYLFYYARREAVPADALVALYQRFFARLGTYKRGRPRLVRPTFGFIPGHSRLCRRRPVPARVVLAGDAAGQHSPLTFCGFGAALRHLPAVVARVQAIVATPSSLGRREARRLPPVVSRREAQLHRATGLLAWLMATLPGAPGLPADGLNRLLAAAFASLADLRPGADAALLRDEMGAVEFAGFLWATARRHPAVWRLVARGLPATRLAGWGGALAGACVQQRLAAPAGLPSASAGG